MHKNNTAQESNKDQCSRGKTRVWFKVCKIKTYRVD